MKLQVYSNKGLLFELNPILRIEDGEQIMRAIGHEIEFFSVLIVNPKHYVFGRCGYLKIDPSFENTTRQDVHYNNALFELQRKLRYEIDLYFARMYGK